MRDIGFIGNQKTCLEEVSPSKILENITLCVVSMFFVANKKQNVDMEISDKFVPTAEFQKRMVCRIPDA